MTTLEVLDPFDSSVALRVSGLLREFNRAGILSTSDVHVAVRLARLGDSTDELACLGAAFAARAPRLGHVCVDLATVRDTASADTDTPADISALAWPDPQLWLEAVSRSPYVGEDLPLHLSDTMLYLDRLWNDERRVASDLLERASAPAAGVDDAVLASGLAQLFTAPEHPDLQRLAAASVVLRRVSVIAGGPGTGKTTTVARALALLDAQATATGQRPPLIALAAPTGKAAARLEEAVRFEAGVLPLDPKIRDRLCALEGTTLHRLLGSNPGNRTRFRHDGLNRLPHDVVVVDETSMVSLSMMARLVEAVRSDARLVLVGDPEQLASIEAGAVLGDIVPPQSRQVCVGEPARERLATVTGDEVPAGHGVPSAIGDGIVVLSKVHRFRGAIAELATAIRYGRVDEAIAVLQARDTAVQWIGTDAPSHATSSEGLGEVRSLAVECGRAVREAAAAGEARAAIAALGRFRLLCAHRRGPDGVAAWMHQVENWLFADQVQGFAGGDDWYIGRPLIVTENDYGLKLYNGDIGVVVADGDRRVAAFERGDDIARVSPARLAAVDTVYAMTVHKSQGSQFHTVAFLLPGVESRVLTRELIYTAVTRAEERLIVIGPEESVRAAIARPITRASGLRRALWGETP